MKVAVTGGTGFLGWHTAVRLRAEHNIESRLLGREDLISVTTLCEALRDVDTVIHLAGVNRASSDEAVEQGNVEIAEILAGALAADSVRRHVVYGNSIQASRDSPYGRGKARASELLRTAVTKGGGTYADVVLPNLFGEHGRPNYNSFVATFCHEVANFRTPEVIGDKEVPLLHAQRAAAALIEAAQRRESHTTAPDGEPHRVGNVLKQIQMFHEVYQEGQIPELPDRFIIELFNTYRSYIFPGHFPLASEVNSDHRGELFETIRMHGSTGQTFVSTTRPGMVRGEHYHLSKVERFFVLSGTADIALRRVLYDDVLTFRLTGGDHALVDMPTLWTHNIRNVGDDDLVTMFWTDQLLDPHAPDTYREAVEPGGET